MKWASSELIYVRVYSKKGGICKLKYKGEEVTLETKNGMEYFPMREGKTFVNRNN
jgi:hypothetical protein